MRLTADDSELEKTEALVGEVRADPGRFPDARTVARHAGRPLTEVSGALRRHFQTSPEDLLLHARCALARRLLADGGASPSGVAKEVGAGSAKDFEAVFRRFHGLTPAAYAALNGARRFTLQLPDEYPLVYLKRALGRDPESPSEELDGDHYRLVARVGSRLSLIHLSLSPREVGVDWSAGGAHDIHAIVRGILGLEQNAAGLVRAARRAGLSRLTAGRAELRIVQTASVYEGLLWAIIGQQINLAFAFALRRRLFELAGEPVPGARFRAAPSPEKVAALDPRDLLPLQFSRQKADYLIGISGRIAAGALDLEGLRSQSATRVQRTLLAERGLGPWSVNYLMMRSLGFGDCVPVGDTGLTSGLQRLLGLEERPDARTTLRLMEVFAPYRSLATAHLWASKPPQP